MKYVTLYNLSSSGKLTTDSFDDLGELKGEQDDIERSLERPEVSTFAKRRRHRYIEFENRAEAPGAFKTNFGAGNDEQGPWENTEIKGASPTQWFCGSEECKTHLFIHKYSVLFWIYCRW